MVDLSIVMLVYQRVALKNPLEMEVLMILMGTSSISMGHL